MGAKGFLIRKLGLLFELHPHFVHLVFGQDPDRRDGNTRATPTEWFLLPEAGIVVITGTAVGILFDRILNQAFYAD